MRHIFGDSLRIEPETSGSAEETKEFGVMMEKLSQMYCKTADLTPISLSQ
jgi:hypothetical protein